MREFQYPLPNDYFLASEAGFLMADSGPHPGRRLKNFVNVQCSCFHPDGRIGSKSRTAAMVVGIDKVLVAAVLAAIVDSGIENRLILNEVVRHLLTWEEPIPGYRSPVDWCRRRALEHGEATRLRLDVIPASRDTGPQKIKPHLFVEGRAPSFALGTVASHEVAVGRLAVEIEGRRWQLVRGRED